MKRTIVLATVLCLAVAVLGIGAAPALAKPSVMMKPLVVTETMTAGLPDHPETWYGIVRGDIKGTEETWGCEFDPGAGAVSSVFLGGVGPGYGVISTDRGIITVYKMDIYIEGTWEFRNVGFVSDATGDWAYLVGWNTYAYGFTTDPFTWGDQYTCTGYRVFLPPLPAKWGKLGVWKPQVMWPGIVSK